MNLLIAALAPIVFARAASGKVGTAETRRGGSDDVAPPNIRGRRTLKGGKHAGPPPPSPPPDTPSDTPQPTEAPVVCADANEKCKDTPCCGDLQCVGNGGGAKCVAPPEPTRRPTSKPTEAGQCPQCIMSAYGGDACGCDNWSTSSLECVSNPTASVIIGYINTVEVLSESFSSGFACSDGAGRYYSGDWCYSGFYTVCNCPDGETMITYAGGTCVPFECSQQVTPDLCA